MAKIIRSINAGWIRPIDLNNQSNSDLLTIINFFMLKTPCKNTSSMGIDLSEYGWNNKNTNTLFKALISEASLVEGRTYMVCTKEEEMSNIARAIGFGNHFNQNRDVNRLVFYHNKKQSKVLNLLYFIRCAIAHGRFAKYEQNERTMYALEAIKKNTSRFMCVISERTLLNWITIITEGPNRLRESYLNEIGDFKRDITELLLTTNQKVTKTYLSNYFRLNKTVINKFISELKSENYIRFNNSTKQWEIIIDDKTQ